MKKRILAVLCVLTITMLTFVGCESKEEKAKRQFEEMFGSTVRISQIVKNVI